MDSNERTTMCHCSSRDFPGNAHCTTCCESFTSETAFREHLVVHKGIVRWHLTPTEAGLERKKNGAWGAPAGNNPFAAKS